MDALTTGAQQMVLLTCGSFFAAWFALAIGRWLTGLLIDAMQDWIGD